MADRVVGIRRHPNSGWEIRLEIDGKPKSRYRKHRRAAETLCAKLCAELGQTHVPKINGPDPKPRPVPKTKPPKDNTAPLGPPDSWGEVLRQEVRQAFTSAWRAGEYTGAAAILRQLVNIWPVVAEERPQEEDLTMVPTAELHQRMAKELSLAGWEVSPQKPKLVKAAGGEGD